MVTKEQIQQYVIDVGYQNSVLVSEGMYELQDMSFRIDYYSMVIDCMKRPLLTKEQKSGLNSIINSLHNYERRNIKRVNLS